VYRLLVLGRSWEPELYELTETLIEQLPLANAVGKRGK
jgi:hypothetical protein